MNNSPNPRKNTASNTRVRRFLFTHNEYDKLATLTGLSSLDLQKLDAMGLLANDIAVNMILKRDYAAQCKITQAPPKLIMQALSNKYGMPLQQIRSILLHKKTPVYYCSQCHKEIPVSEYQRLHGICEQCTVASIKL